MKFIVEEKFKDYWYQKGLAMGDHRAKMDFAKEKGLLKKEIEFLKKKK